MSRPGQKPREQTDGSVVRLLAPWRWRPIWQGLSLLVLMIAGGVYGVVLSARERAVQATLTGTLDGLRLLAVERDVSIAAHDLLAALAMDMYEGGRDVEVALKREALRVAALEAGESLAARPPTERWRLVHRGMTEAADRMIRSLEEPAPARELQSRIDEFLYDFKRVVPTDDAGAWSALLDVASWAQDVPLVFRDYLQVAMAREWAVEGRTPHDESLEDEYVAWLNGMRRLRESHGGDAGDLSFLEDYILIRRAHEADSVAVALTDRLAGHPGVRQLEQDTPYLLALTDEPAFGSIEELYRDRSQWVPGLEAIAAELLRHARSEVESGLAASHRRAFAGRASAATAFALAALFAIVSIRRRMQFDDQLREALQQDVLTGLANRYALFNVAPALLQSPEAASFALIQLDLDDFKSINDEHGHHVGDRALIEFASALTSVVRADRDLVCRIGGDEFVLVLHGLDDAVHRVEAVVDRLQDRLERPVTLEGTPMQLDFTAGVAVSDEPVSLQDLLVEADLALIEAKEKRRQGAQFFRRKLGRRMVRELQTALGSGDLRCLFQPQVDVETGMPVGLEALARWQREDRMEVPARNLIDALEWLGAGRDWLRVVMQDTAAAWDVASGRMGGRLWLNLMRTDLEAAGPEELLAILGGTGVPLDRLGVEITEPIDRARIPSAAALLESVRAAGVGVALDDVGHHRVPLLHVTELPVDRVKIDHSIVRGIDRRAELRAVAQSLVDLSHSLGLEVIAEGVETAAEEAALRKLGVRYAQGFLYARPLPLAELGPFLEQARARGNVA